LKSLVPSGSIGREAALPEIPETHYRMVLKAVLDGRVVPLLGAGVNLCGRPSDLRWTRDDRRYLPSGAELAEFLADYFEYPDGGARELVRVSQYAAVVVGSGPLYDELHQLFDHDFPPSPLHELLAELPAYVREHSAEPQHQLVVTTNYDDALERAFAAAGEEFDLVSYVAEGESRGKFLHRPPGDEPRLIERPNEYDALDLARRTVILKIHGAVDRGDADRDSYVITEDHYIDYLTRTDISALVPAVLAAKLRKSHFLFLGYGMRDWNLRVILHRIWGEQRLSYRSWAVQLEPDRIEREFWGQRGVEILEAELEDYVAGLRRAAVEPLETGVAP
jgi:hypothetical protein